MPLFGSKTEVSIDVDRDTVVAGEVVKVSANIGELDKKVQGARVELGYRNTYKEDDRDSDGDRRTVTRTSDVVVVHEPLDTSGGSPGAIQQTLAVPSHVPGTAVDSVEWFVRVVVDRKLARDANAEHPLTVLVPAEPLVAWTQNAPESTSNDCHMEITASTRAVKPGDSITGTLTITPRESLKVRGVRVQLRRVRYDPDRNTDTNDDRRVELGGEAEIAPGGSHTIDFEIPVPEDAAPSFQAQYNHQHWYLEGVLDMKMKSDPTARAEVVVHTA